MPRGALARLAALAGTTILLSSCASSGGGDGVVTLDYWCWGLTEKVEEFNRTHPGIQVDHTDAGGGNDSSTKLLTASRAGNAPDVTCVEYQTIPAMIVSDVLVDIADHTREVEREFTPETWQLTSFEGHVYGIPQDVGPMVLLYNRARFEELDIPVPTTWEEYADVAAEVRRKDPDTYITTFSPNEFGEMAGLAQQAGAQWWQVEDRRWSVGIADEPSRRVAAYWQDLVDRDLVQAEPLLTPEWNNRVNRGEILTWPSGVWSPGVIHGIAEQQAGDWAIAPLPRWEDGTTAGVPMQGGSALTVTSDDEVEAAVEFITWMNTSEAACALQIEEGQYPASTAGQAMTAGSPPPPLTGDQEDYWEVAHGAAQDALPSIQWGPNVGTATTEYQDAAAAILEGGSLVDALEKTQDAVVEEMERGGFDLTTSG